MSEIQDMTTQMAKELMLGIQDSVEDLAVYFKKMAILHEQAPPAPVEDPVAEIAPEIAPAEEYHPQLIEYAEAKTTQKRKSKIRADEDQLSFFDLVA